MELYRTNSAKCETFLTILRMSFTDFAFVARYDTENHRGMYSNIKPSGNPALPALGQTAFSNLYHCIITSLYSPRVRLTLGDFVAHNGPEQRDSFSSRDSTPLMKIAKVQNRYSNYPNKKD